MLSIDGLEYFLKNPNIGSDDQFLLNLSKGVTDYDATISSPVIIPYHIKIYMNEKFGSFIDKQFSCISVLHEVHRICNYKERCFKYVENLNVSDYIGIETINEVLKLKQNNLKGYSQVITKLCEYGHYNIPSPDFRDYWTYEWLKDFKEDMTKLLYPYLSQIYNVVLNHHSTQLLLIKSSTLHLPIDIIIKGQCENHDLNIPYNTTICIINKDIAESREVFYQGVKYIWERAIDSAYEIKDYLNRTFNFENDQQHTQPQEDMMYDEYL